MFSLEDITILSISHVRSFQHIQTEETGKVKDLRSQYGTTRDSHFYILWAIALYLTENIYYHKGIWRS